MKKVRKVEKQKLTLNLSEPKGLKKDMAVPPVLVNSKIEITKPQSSKDTQRAGLADYRKGIKDMAVTLKDDAIGLAEGNLLNAKLGLWEAMAVVERMMKENRSV